jgi:pilus assembly protein Flp/PilA
VSCCYNGFNLDEYREEVSEMLFLPREEGQGLVEYALILVLVAIVVIVVLALLGPTIGNIFSQIMQAL